MADNASVNYAKLDSLYGVLKTLTSTSSEAETSAFAAFFDDEHTSAYLRSMREVGKPCTSRQQIVEDLRKILETVKLEEQRVTSRSSNADGSKIYVEMENKLLVCGELLEPHCETAVVSFNSKGLISDLKIYSCWSWITRIMQAKTGVGPYRPELVQDCCNGSGEELFAK